MDPERWNRIETLCDAALGLPQPERSAYLESQCSGDAELRDEIEELLRSAEGDPNFLGRPLVRLGDVAPSATGQVADPPRAIGPYRLIRQLGRGGMGEVYLAMHRTEDLEQEVALKIIRRGKDTEEVLRRFRLERRILARLHHPNIARLLDAGATVDGRPYFVMEYVEGRPIDVFCDDRKLPIDARLELFQTVCTAVQHAHQTLVVHRDLKPSNILVSAAGVPKLLDFGIGKVLSDSEAFGSAIETRSDVRLLTPEYAAPEQILAQPVTTATDVHGLGVLLYELLTGRHPYVSNGPSSGREIEQAILESTPAGLTAAVSATAGAGTGPRAPLPAAEISARRAVAPVQLRRQLAGDLDTIVLKALRKEPERRYASAAALAEDIRRYLAGLPVSARPDTLGYRVRKFVRRNVVPVAAAAVAMLALGATTLVTLVQSRRVASESARVAAERDKLLEVRGFLMEMFGATGADRAVGDTVTARRLLDLQVPQLAQAYEGRPALEAEMREVLADGYDRLGLYREAEPLARQALGLKREALGPDHPDVAAALNLVGWIAHELGRPQEAESLLGEAVASRRKSGRPLDLARSLNDLGVVQHVRGKGAEAAESLTEALDIRRATYGERHRAIGITASNLAVVHYGLSRFDEAVRHQELAVDILTATVGANHQRTLIALTNLATFQYSRGDFAGAEGAYRDVLRRQTELQGRRHPQTGITMMSLATAIMARTATSPDDSSQAEAEALVRESVSVAETNLGPRHPEVAAALTRLSGVLAARRQPTEAWTVQARAFEIYRDVYGPDHRATGTALAGLADIRWRLGHVDRAIELKRRAVEILDKAAGPTHSATTEARGSLCTYLSYRSDDAAEAVDVCGRVVQDLQNAPAGQARHLTRFRLRLAQGQLALGRTAIADSILTGVREAIEGDSGGDVERRLLDSLTARIAPVT